VWVAEQCPAAIVGEFAAEGDRIASIALDVPAWQVSLLQEALCIGLACGPRGGGCSESGGTDWLRWLCAEDRIYEVADART
jgi:hypothetical protein